MSDDLIKRAIRVMNEQDEWGTAFDMIRSIEEHGLALVPAADVVTNEVFTRTMLEMRRKLETCQAQLRDQESATQRLSAELTATDVPTPEERAALESWTHQHGAALVPHGQWADTFGDGMRCAKQQVAALLARRAAKEANRG